MQAGGRPADATTPREHWAITVASALLWLIGGAFALLGAAAMLGLFDNAGTDAAGRGMSASFGLLFLVIGGGAIVCLLVARRWRGALILAALILVVPIAFFATYSISMSRSEARNRAERAEMRSGKYDFGDQPALFAVAEAIAQNNQEAIRAAAKKVPDLQAPGRDGKTLLAFAVTQSWQQPQLVEAVATLLSLGADPNFTNEHQDSYAMALSVHGSAALLRTMLDAGGNPNALDPQGNPMIFGNWRLGYFEGQQRTRFELLLDRGADLNSTLSQTESYHAGYTLLLYRVEMSRGDSCGYAEALLLLERGADANRTAADGMTLAKMLGEHRQFYGTVEQAAPPEYDALCNWLREHGIAIEG